MFCPPLNAPAAASAPPAEAPSSLPTPVGGFVGRERELADLLRRLTDQDCRLLTLVGPGGVGKTQLALRAAQQLAAGWAGEAAIADGVIFVSLAAVRGADELVIAMAAAARFRFYPAVPPRQQLLDYLRDKRMLALLDGCEQLGDAAGLLAELLATAPGLRLLATSREALNLQGEWFHPLDGLSVPDEAAAQRPVAGLARFDAVRLFEQHARRFQSGFSLSRERAHVVRLCRLVAGTPLAIELAASWLKLLTVEQIVAALERDLDILVTRSRELPERHRSMRTVLEESWRLLAGDEQRALAELSLLGGSFTAAAAQAVAGANLATLAALAERSLLRSVGEGRFQLHELLRQFAAERLAAEPERANAARARHGAFFLALLAEQGAQMAGPTLQAAVATTARESDQICAAWQWACERRQVALLDGTILPYHHFLFHQSAFQEGRDCFAMAVAMLCDPPGPAEASEYGRVAARAYVRLGAFCYFLGDHAASEAALAEGVERARAHGLQYEIALARLFQGAAAGGRGEVGLARAQLQEALSIGRASGETALISSGLNNLAALDGLYGDFAEGKRLAEESVALNRSLGESERTAHALVQLAWLCACRGEYAESERGWHEALALFERVESRYGIAMATGGVGYVAWCVGGERLDEAEARTRRSLELLRTINHRLSIASRLSDLALIELDRGLYQQAERYATEGLAVARQVNSTIYTAAHLAILGHLAAVAGAFDQGRVFLDEALSLTAASKLAPRLASTCYQIALLTAREAEGIGEGAARAERQAAALALLAAVGAHEATMHTYRVRSHALAEELGRALPPEVAEAATARGRGLDLAAGGAALLAQAQGHGGAR